MFNFWCSILRCGVRVRNAIIVMFCALVVPKFDLASTHLPKTASFKTHLTIGRLRGILREGKVKNC